MVIRIKMSAVGALNGNSLIYKSRMGALYHVQQLEPQEIWQGQKERRGFGKLSKELI
jgi:hypothetical protein